MAAQLEYGYDVPKGFPGGKYDLAFDNVFSATYSGETDLTPGVVVCFDTDTTKVTAYDKAKTIAGVVLNGLIYQIEAGTAYARKHANESTKVEYINGDTLNVLPRGNVWVRVNDDFTMGGKVYLATDGSFTSATTTAVVTNARWVDYDKTHGIAVVSGDFTQITNS